MSEKNEVVQLNLNDIIPNRFQPREVFDEKALKELAVSIKEHGVIQPIIVREVNGKYEIIAGERRYKASVLAGMTKIPALVRNLDDKESSKVALLENLQRKNLNPIEEAKTFQKILEIDEMTQEELAKTMGKSQSAVSNKLRLLSLPNEVQEALLKEQISERHARALLKIEDSKTQTEMLNKVIDNKMSVRKLEEEIKSINGENKEVPSVNMFIDSNPLKPTAEIPKEVDNFGKVTIAPPEGEETPMGKFINYGELDKEEDNEENDDMPLLPPSTVNPEEVKKKADNIPVNNSSADLDNLLNLSSINGNSNNNNYITEAEKIVKSDSSTPNEKIEDYFKTPDLNGFSLPQNSIVEDNNEEEKNETENENDNVLLPPSNLVDMPSTLTSVDDGIAKIRKFVEELKETNLPITADEMDFEQSYQIIIKIDKE